MIEPRIWVTGAGGLIGAYVVAEMRRRCPKTYLRALTRDILNLGDPEAIDALYQHDRPTDVIHCAALSRPQDCEANPALAQAINIEATQRLLERFEERPFVFLSTDVVFDGSRGAYREDDPVNPLGRYAETKVQGELLVKRNPKSLIIRTSLNGGVSRTRDRGFNEPIYRAWSNGKTTELFEDEFRNPIGAAVTARHRRIVVATRHRTLPRRRSPKTVSLENRRITRRAPTRPLPLDPPHTLTRLCRPSASPRLQFEL